MQNQSQSLRDKARLSFENRKNNYHARLTFLQDAKILDESGNYNSQFFSKSSANTNQAIVK